MRDAIELAQIVIEGGGIAPATVSASSFPSFGATTVPEMRTPVLTQLTFERRTVQIMPGRVVVLTTRPLGEDLSPEREAATAFVENYVGQRAQWRLAVIIQLRCLVPDDRQPEDWLRRLVQADSIAEIQAPLPLDVNLEITFPFAPGRGVVRIERSRVEPLNALFFLVQFGFDNPTIQNLNELETYVSEGSELADKVMALVQTEVAQ